MYKTEWQKIRAWIMLVGGIAFFMYCSVYSKNIEGALGAVIVALVASQWFTQLKLRNIEQEIKKLKNAEFIQS